MRCMASTFLSPEQLAKHIPMLRAYSLESNPLRIYRSMMLEGLKECRWSVVRSGVSSHKDCDSSPPANDFVISDC